MGLITKICISLIDPFGIFRGIINRIFNSSIFNFYHKWHRDSFINATARDVAVKASVLTFAAALIIWASIFMYITFYYTYMPAIEHIRPVFMQFE